LNILQSLITLLTFFLCFDSNYMYIYNLKLGNTINRAVELVCPVMWTLNYHYKSHY